jgi:hypothetical protein
MLGWRGLIVGKDLVERPLEWAQLERVSFRKFGNRLGLCQGLPDGDPGEHALVSNLPDGFSVAVSAANGSINHPP